jgi:DNA-binding NarL/FixJ family response regulator
MEVIRSCGAVLCSRSIGPDQVLLDLRVPDIPAGVVLCCSREQGGIADVPGITLSREATTKRENRLLAGGAAACLSKRIDVRKVRRTVDEALNGSHWQN